MFYWGLWWLVALFSIILSRKMIKSNSTYGALYFFIFLLAIIIGGREYVGTDWESYKQFYEFGYDSTGRENMDFLFQGLRNLFTKIGFSYGFFSFIVSLFSLTALCKSFKIAEVNNCWLAFLVYLSMFLCNYQFNVIRHGAMASFVLLSFMYKAKDCTLKSLISLLLAVGFHKIGIIFLLLFPIINRSFNSKLILWIFVFAILVFISGLGGTGLSIFTYLAINMGFEGYLDIAHWGPASSGISIGQLGKILIFFYSFIFRRKLYESSSIFRVSVNLLFISIISNLLFNDFAVFTERVVNAMSMSLVIILPYLLKISSGSSKVLFYMVVLAYLFLYYPMVWNRDEANMLPFVFNLRSLFV